MKRTVLFLTIALGLTSAVVAQKEEKEEKSVNPPVAAKTAFTKAFPGSSNEKWEKEGKNYEVNFKQNGNEMSAVMSKQGVLQETELAINISELPAAVADYVKQHYKEASIKKADKITKATGEVNFEAQVNKKALIFDKDGKFVKVEKD